MTDNYVIIFAGKMHSLYANINKKQPDEFVRVENNM